MIGAVSWAATECYQSQAATLLPSLSTARRLITGQIDTRSSDTPYRGNRLFGDRERSIYIAEPLLVSECHYRINLGCAARGEVAGRETRQCHDDYDSR